MTKFNKQNVYEVYDKIFSWFDSHRNKSLMEKEYLELIDNLIPKNASILDIGCGNGNPIAKYFIEKSHHITGVDGILKMIGACKQNFPEETWLKSDMREPILNKTFNAVIAWHSFFHLNHDDQRKTLQLFISYLKPQGVLAFTSGYEHGEVWSNNGGENLYHASLSTHEYKKILESNGMKILAHKIKDPNCGDATVWLAQLREKNEK